MFFSTKKGANHSILVFSLFLFFSLSFFLLSLYFFLSSFFIFLFFSTRYSTWYGDECSALLDTSDARDDGDDDFFKPRNKSAAEQEQENEDFRLWLAGQGESKLAPEMKKDLEPLQRFWTDPNLSEDDRFLRDYITRQLWREDRVVLPVRDKVSATVL